MANAMENDYMFMNLTSTCNIDLIIVAGGVHTLDGTCIVHTPIHGQKIVFMHELIIGTDQRIGFSSSTSKAYGTVNVCPYPTLLNSNFSTQHCVQFELPDLSQYIYIQADSTSVMFESQFLYYTFSSNETDNTTSVYVMQQPIPVLEHDINYTTVLDGGERQHLMMRRTYDEDNFYFDVNVLDAKGGVCISRIYQDTINADCDNFTFTPGIISISNLSASDNKIYITI